MFTKIDENLLKAGYLFHGHKCPAMPLGIKAGIIALKALGAEKSKDKELYLISEIGKGHAMGCFLDGLMIATGCTYGKGNIEKTYRNSLAFTLIDTKNNKKVYVEIRPEFVKKALQSEFVSLRKKGVAPQDIDEKIIQPLINRVLETNWEEQFKIEGPVPCEQPIVLKGTFRFDRCSSCGKYFFVKEENIVDNRPVCTPCLSKK